MDRTQQWTITLMALWFGVLTFVIAVWIGAVRLPWHEDDCPTTTTIEDQTYIRGDC